MWVLGMGKGGRGLECGGGPPSDMQEVQTSLKELTRAVERLEKGHERLEKALDERLGLGNFLGGVMEELRGSHVAIEELRKSHTAIEEELKKTRDVKREKRENELAADIEELKKSVATLEETLRNIHHVRQVQQVPSCDAQDQQTSILPDKKTGAQGDIYNTSKMQHSSPVKILFPGRPLPQIAYQQPGTGACSVQCLVKEKRSEICKFAGPRWPRLSAKGVMTA